VADIQPYPIPGTPGPGPAPVPYSGPDPAPEPPDYDPGPAAISYPGSEVMGAAAGGILQESAAAHDVNAGSADAPYYAGDISPVFAGGDADAGGRDDVAGTVAGSVAAAEARYIEHESDTHAQGSAIGDLMDLPSSPDNPAVGMQGAEPPFEEPYFPETNPA
jgi:hypothetical protein